MWINKIYLPFNPNFNPQRTCMDTIDQIREKMREENLLFVYRGVITSENSVPLLLLLEKEMERSEFSYLGRKRLFMFVLESLQNVSRHKDSCDTAAMSIVVYSKTDGGYSVSTGNVISSSNIPDLKERLDGINKLNVDEIRSVYRRMLSNSKISSKGGAGLGLIEMAKKTGNRLDYDFLEIDDEKSYFILNKTVDSEGMGLHQAGDRQKSFRGDSVANLEKLMTANNIYMIWSGRITSDIGEEVISFNETKLLEDMIDSTVRRRVFSVLVETMENMSKYGVEKQAEELYGMPVVILKLEGQDYRLTTGNLIRNEEVPVLKEKIDTINRYNRDDLKDFYRKSLSEQTVESERTGNMGLIDMARKSGAKLGYRFDTINETYSYFNMTIPINRNFE